ncbi:MAG TPA: class I SAM-dependent methyltransferase [Kribbellaceae bacterium]
MRLASDRSLPGTTSYDVPPYDELAEVYDELLRPGFFPHLSRVLDRLIRAYGLDLGAVADVGCGTGRLLDWFRDRGARELYGTDASAAMLRVARSRTGFRHPVLLRQRFAELDLPRPVSLITCTFDALNYELTPAALLAALRAIRANLAPGGHVVFDLVVAGPGGPVPPCVEHARRPGVRLVRISRWHPRTRVMRADVWVIHDDGRVGHELHVQRAYPVPAVCRLLRRAGLSPAGVHDFDTLRRPSASTRRAVFVARRGPVSC